MLFLSIDCNGNLDTAQRRTSALQTSKYGQMDATGTSMCFVEIQHAVGVGTMSSEKVNLFYAFYVSGMQENENKSEEGER